MKYFVHSTSLSNANRILKEGLKPVGNGTGNWFTNVGGNKQLVYLGSNIGTSDLTIDHYALRACIVSKDRTGVVLKINPRAINYSNLRVDENFLDFEERQTSSNCPLDTRRRQRTVALHDTRWKASLTATGACAYAGTINTKAIKGVAYIDVTKTVFYRPWMLDFDRFSVRERCYIYDNWLSNFMRYASDYVPHQKTAEEYSAWFDIDPVRALAQQSHVWTEIGQDT
jgi:hypothetical protein